MAEPGRKLAQRLVELWNEPASDRPKNVPLPAHVRDGVIFAEDILQALLNGFTFEQVREEIIHVLDSTSKSREHSPDLSDHDRFLADCCLGLAALPVDWKIPEEVVGRVVRTFPFMVFMSEIGRLISTCVTESQAMKALLPGLEENHPNLLGCLAAIPAYLPRARSDPDPASHSLVLRQLISRVELFSRSSDPVVADMGRDALQFLRKRYPAAADPGRAGSLNRPVT